MRRIITLIILFLLLGAMVNVAVAWSVQFIWPVDTSCSDAMIEKKSDRSSPLANIAFCAHHTETAVYYHCYTTVARNHAIPYVDNMESETPAWLKRCLRRHHLTGGRQWGPSVTAYASGWPMHSMFGSFYIEEFDDSPIEDINGAIILSPPQPQNVAVGHRSSYSRIVPLRPIWPGFALNTLLYAATLWLLFAAPFQLRRIIRKHNRRCPKCGYDLRGTEHKRCPECGAATI